MKRLSLLSLGLFAASAALADNAFPGLQKIMTEAEWKRAGLDKLTPDQIGVIDAAVIRHVSRGSTVPAATSTPAPTSPPVPDPNASAAQNAAAQSRFWDKFGLGRLANDDWRSQSPMVAKVTAWRGANGFVLDNGQVWEGQEKIPFDILGQSVTIEPRPMEAFALRLTDGSMSVRVRRVR